MITSLHDEFWSACPMGFLYQCSWLRSSQRCQVPDVGFASVNFSSQLGGLVSIVFAILPAYHSADKRREYPDSRLYEVNDGQKMSKLKFQEFNIYVYCKVYIYFLKNDDSGIPRQFAGCFFEGPVRLTQQDLASNACRWPALRSHDMVVNKLV